MLAWIKTRMQAEDGAVTIDWVVLTAGIVGLGLVVLGPIAFNTTNAIDSVATDITEIDSHYMYD